MNADEYDCIDAMLKAAREEGLEVEVVVALYNAARTLPNVPVQDAVFDALWEWNLLPPPAVYEAIRVVDMLVIMR